MSTILSSKEVMCGCAVSNVIMAVASWFTVAVSLALARARKPRELFVSWMVIGDVVMSVIQFVIVILSPCSTGQSIVGFTGAISPVVSIAIVIVADIFTVNSILSLTIIGSIGMLAVLISCTIGVSFSFNSPGIGVAFFVLALSIAIISVWIFHRSWLQQFKTVPEWKRDNRGSPMESYDENFLDLYGNWYGKVALIKKVIWIICAAADIVVASAEINFTCWTSYVYWTPLILANILQIIQSFFK